MSSPSLSPLLPIHPAILRYQIKAAPPKPVEGKKLLGNTTGWHTQEERRWIHLKVQFQSALRYLLTPFNLPHHCSWVTAFFYLAANGEWENSAVF